MSIVSEFFSGYGWVLYLSPHLIEDIAAIGETFIPSTYQPTEHIGRRPDDIDQFKDIPVFTGTSSRDQAERSSSVALS